MCVSNNIFIFLRAGGDDGSVSVCDFFLFLAWDFILNVDLHANLPRQVRQVSVRPGPMPSLSGGNFSH